MAGQTKKSGLQIAADIGEVYKSTSGNCLCPCAIRSAKPERMVQSEQYYLERAVDMLELARGAKTEELRRGFLKAEEAYRALAETAANAAIYGFNGGQE